MTGNPRGLQREALRLPDPPDVLESAADGRESRGVLHVVLPGIQGSTRN